MSDTAYSQDDNIEKASDELYASDTVDASRKARPVPRISIQAFCEDQSFVDAMQNASNDRRMNKAHLSMQMGGISAALETYRDGLLLLLLLLGSRLLLLDVKQVFAVSMILQTMGSLLPCISTRSKPASRALPSASSKETMPN